MPNPMEFILNNRKEIDPTLCVILMPFSEEFNEIYESCLRPVVNSKGLTCKRADEIYSTNSIIEDIIGMIQTAHIVIADISFSNPNVLYELGISHVLKEKVIILTQEIDKLPFDTSHIRTIGYKNSISGGIKLKKDLEQMIENIKNEPILNHPLNQHLTKEPPKKELDIKILNGADNCLKSIVEELKRYQDQYGDAICIYRALAVEYTREIFTNPNEEVIKLLEEYENIIKYIIQEGEMGVENWDYTIYGRVKSSSLNNATIEFIKRVYFQKNKVPDTSEIGINLSLDVESFFIIGHRETNNGAFQPDAGFMIFGEESYDRPSSGFLFHQKELLHLLVSKFWVSLKSKCNKNNVYWNLLKFQEEPKKLDLIEKQIESLLTTGNYIID